MKESLKLALEALEDPVLFNDVNNAKWGKPWVSLTDEEARWLYNNHRTPSNLIEAVEAKLKEKNT